MGKFVRAGIVLALVSCLLCLSSPAEEAAKTKFTVEFTLADGATKKLVEACGDAPGRWLTVYVNGHWYGTTYFNKSKPDRFRPPAAGFMLSQANAEQILNASQ